MAEDRIFYSDTRFIFRIIWIILVILTAGFLYSIYKPYVFIPEQIRYLNTALHVRLKPSGILGHALGIVGTIFMFLSYILYFLRKKLECLEFLGPLSLWLEIHMFFGILGPVLIMFHSAFSFTGNNRCGFLAHGRGGSFRDFWQGTLRLLLFWYVQDI